MNISTAKAVTCMSQSLRDMFLSFVSVDLNENFSSVWCSITRGLDNRMPFVEKVGENLKQRLPVGSVQFNDEINCSKLYDIKVLKGFLKIVSLWIVYTRRENTYWFLVNLK